MQVLEKKCLHHFEQTRRSSGGGQALASSEVWLAIIQVRHSITVSSTMIGCNKTLCIPSFADLFVKNAQVCQKCMISSHLTQVICVLLKSSLVGKNKCNVWRNKKWHPPPLKRGSRTAPGKNRRRKRAPYLSS